MDTFLQTKGPYFRDLPGHGRPPVIDVPRQPQPPVGLRSSKKHRTRTTLWLEAMKLFADKGPSQTTVADIARSAGISERTFFRYYPTKESVLVGMVEQFYGNLAKLVISRPAPSGFLRSVSSSIADAYALTHGSPDVDGHIREGIRNSLEVYKATPSARFAVHNIITDTKERLAGHLAEQWGFDPERDPRPRAMANIGLSLVYETAHWWAHDRSRGLNEIAGIMAEVATGGESAFIGR
ncbi:TetR/AcrR family transcriptional regulator [Amycolatopsis nigrescens]|uniref:TetR/AcrR family transcriptional regulator n=1 Tax=Amycolatopsis nigrescens TaxID=381445 RepID=UPI00035F67F9|nr:TetR/AcrR family transcriptional regulator [Amycolatopsis nigrescens]